MKYLTDFSKTVETGVDPRVESKNEYHVTADLFLAVVVLNVSSLHSSNPWGMRGKEILQGFGGGDG